MNDYNYPNAQALATHPMYDHIAFWRCEKSDCHQNNVLVSEAAYSIHPHSGDAYGKYTLTCQLCGKVEQKSFADN
ncbi:MAG: hypothetical protein MUE85_06220 [Microscillaceae bacterium]|jgi:hypothetical protein|nr:hypothetical protein [Microscillaceae bacterium]